MACVKLDIMVPDRGKFQHALDEARTQGLEVSRVFADLGLISGTIEAKSVGGLVHIDGIASVVPDRRPQAPSLHGRTVVPFPRR